MNVTERAQGAMVGLAVGDALGFPLEGLSARLIARRFPDLSRYRFLGRTGYVSDDTEQAVMLAQSLLESQGEPLAAARAFRRRLVGWFLTLPPGIGMATVKASLLGRGVGSAGNGAAMRAAPLGLWPDPHPDLDAALARVTHTDPRAVDGARAVAHTVRLLVAGHSADWPSLRQVMGALDSRLEQALDRAWELSQGGDLSPLGLTGYVLHSVPLALATLWADPPDFHTGLLGLVRRGGDTDSHGAIAGAFLGARFGVQAIPSSWADCLEGCYARSRLEQLARDLLGRGPLRPGPPLLAARGRELVIKAGVALHVLRRLVWFL